MIVNEPFSLLLTSVYPALKVHKFPPETPGASGTNSGLSSLRRDQSIRLKESLKSDISLQIEVHDI